MTNIIFHILNCCLLTVILSFTTWMPAQAEEMTCPEHISIDIDIKPGSYPNAINLSSRGLLPVAVLSTQEFNASLFTPEMAHLMDANTPMQGSCPGNQLWRWTRDDVNYDGQTDLVFFFRIQDLNFTLNTTSAILMAHGSYGGDILHLMGKDSVKVWP